jgi:hypothetical protein
MSTQEWEYFIACIRNFVLDKIKPHEERHELRPEEVKWLREEYNRTIKPLF